MAHSQEHSDFEPAEFGRGEPVKAAKPCAYAIPSGRGMVQCVSREEFDTWHAHALQSPDIWEDIADVVTSGVDRARGAVRAIGEGLGSIPVIGHALEGVWTGLTGQFEFVGALLSGERIDRAALAALQKQLDAAKAVAPWAQAILSFVPAVGPVASAVLAASIAIANGQPIDEIMADAIAAGIPGGALAKAIYKTAKDVATGKARPLDVLATLMTGVASGTGIKLPPNVQRIVESDHFKHTLGLGVDGVARLARGEKLDDAFLHAAEGRLVTYLGAQASPLIDRARGIGVTLQEQLAAQVHVADLLTDTQKLVPQMPAGASEAIRQGLTLGMTMGTALGIQNQMRINLRGSVFTGAVENAMAANVSAVSAVVSSGRAQSGTPHAYDLGNTLAQHNLQPFVYTTIRKGLSSAQQKAFDSAIALNVGKILKPLAPPKSAKQAVAQASFQTVVGTVRTPGPLRVAIAAPLVATSAGRAGVDVAIKTLAREKSWFRKLFEVLGFVGK